ncbi:hypothetical protein SEMRO_832_G208490.1 [Seminavis robusta]|uniref:Uncharacterized protein n=1 Tax=Seminavis robusta TaxID=568900 RepID=A0A9N8EB88_9STRA|nr:hypothetical protein SEMRO_832_G208490.1 [Seminavis robusta]|eukprot:Sro832_g208490.1 n/a (222) ;mRNA; r:37329-37994
MFKYLWKRSSKTNEEARDKQDAPPVDAITVCTNSSRNSKSSRSSKKSRGKTKSKTKQDAPTPTAGGKTPNELAVERFFVTMNAHAPMEDLIAYFTSSDAPIKFDDSKAMNATILATEIQKVYAGFEDATWNCGSIKEVKPNVVLLDELCVTGTHTGPYQFANFPPVEATHKSIVLDPECCWFYMKDGKFQSEDIIALGSLTGPPGMYISVGGKMDSTPPGE